MAEKMNTPEIPDEKAVSATDTVLDSGTYEIIRQRLNQHTQSLQTCLGNINEARKALFGAIDTVLLGSERVITRNNCIPRDMATFGNHFLFGYNVHLGLKSITSPEDVFSTYKYESRTFKESVENALNNEKFVRDFQEMYKYYKETKLAKLMTNGPHFYMMFQIGKETADTKVFKWVMENGSLRYIDNRSSHELTLPPQHDFEWKRATRESYRRGLHPHISIEDRLFVETIEGDLTIKIEDNTDTGKGIYSEPVEKLDQSLEDAEVLYAIIGNLILLKLRPYQERNYRYFLFNEKTEQVLRIDTISESCIMLPDNHGLIFPNGYYLRTGDYKFFDTEIKNLQFESRIAAPNGEDFQYVFYNQREGVYVILSYNSIAQKVEMPLICSGYSYFENGELLLFKAESEPRNNHTLQIWQTPFTGPNFTTEHLQTDSLLSKIGNKEIVRCMSECQIVLSLLNKEDSYANLYIDIAKASERILDTYFWLDKPDACGLKTILGEISSTSSGAVEEFEKVSRLKKTTRQSIDTVCRKVDEILAASKLVSSQNIEWFVQILASLRALRGEIISLKELRYADTVLIDQLESIVKNRADELSQQCISYLLTPDALKHYSEKVINCETSIDVIQKTAEGTSLDEKICSVGKDLELLIDIVSNLKIADSTNTTTIIDRISTIYGDVNRVRSALRSRCKDLRMHEGAAEFRAQMKLLDQAVANFIDIADSPQRCDDYFTKILVQIEEIESKFSDYDEFIPELAQKRTELSSVFESKKAALQEQRSRTCNSLFSAADRILKGIENRLRSFQTLQEINGFLASDLMVDKVRDIIERLFQAGDSVKSDEITGKLKNIKEDALRQLRDKADLFDDNEQIIKFGSHRFTVSTHDPEIAIILKDEHLYYHISGTDFFEKADSVELEKTREAWTQEVISETRDVYRGEYLTWLVLKESLAGNFGKPEQLTSLQLPELTSLVSKFMAPRFDEGYQKGVHDFDAAVLLKELCLLRQSVDLLIFSPSARALARLFWINNDYQELRQKTETHLKGLHQALKTFNGRERFEHYIAQLEPAIKEYCIKTEFFDPALAHDAAHYLCEERRRGERFVISLEADSICRKFLDTLKERRGHQSFTSAMESFGENKIARLRYARDWLQTFFDETRTTDDLEFMDEAALMLALDLHSGKAASDVISSPVHRVVKGLRGDHAVIRSGEYTLVYSSFVNNMKLFESVTVPQYLLFKDTKKKLIDIFRQEVRLDEYKSRVLSSFVRSKLINELYLPLIGDNLAKQIGVAGIKKRTDLMGLLLLISPPGYGKTTLMEYVASRLGVIFMKINAPALGNRVISLDPAEAPNASAKEELVKLNLAFQMGNNVMIYVDDIQHSNPEFLEKFISLCDAQRKIEGVYKGSSRTYDFRGKKVIIVMAGNPYTESGERFKIPDMLANRADTYNLGDMLNANEDAFKLSYIENALTSNPVLSELANRSQKDFYSFVKAAKDGARDGLDLESDYSPEQLNDIVLVLKKLMFVRDIVLKVNMEYIRSAAQAHEYRTEPSFKLQGSYRNMNRIAERVLPVINDKELFNLVVQSYEFDSQTLTTGAEANLLKWKELNGCLNEKEKERWEFIKKSFNQNKLVKADDKLGQTILLLGKLEDGLGNIRDAIVNRSDTENNDTKPSIAIDPVALERVEKVITSIGDTLKQGSNGASDDTTTAALILVLENQMNVMKEWFGLLQQISEKKAGNTETLHTAINRSLWFQRKLVARFLGEERADRKAAKEKDLDRLE